jgi:hypothetical protein
MLQRPEGVGLEKNRHLTAEMSRSEYNYVWQNLEKTYSNFMIERLRKDGGEEGNAKGRGVKTSTEWSWT